MPSQRTPSKPHKASAFSRRRVTRQTSQTNGPTSTLPPVTVKADPLSLNSSSSMSADYSGYSSHSQLTQQPHYGGAERPCVGQGLHTPHHNSSFDAFNTPVDLTGASLLAQSDYQTLTNSLPQSGMSSYRQNQSNGDGGGGTNNSFNLSTPQNNPFTSSAGPHTPSHRTMSPETHSQPHTHTHTQHPVPRPPFPSYMPRQPAAEVVRSIRSQNFRLDSTVCKKLAIEPALRTPEQRNRERILNMGRRGNAEALLCQITGQEAANPCKNCKRGHGPWTKCVVYSGLFYGSCSNCWFNASGARCTFQESNHHPLHQLYASMAPSYNNPFPPTSGAYPYGSGGPVNPSSYPYGAAAAAAIAGRTREGVPLGNVHFDRPAGASNGDDGGPATGSSHPADSEVIHPNAVRDLTEGMIIDSVSWGVRARYLARIQAAASELGMRLGEYEEFLVRNNLIPNDDFHDSERQSGLPDGGDDEAENDLHQQDDGSQSPNAVERVEKRERDTSGSDDADESEDADQNLRDLSSSLR